MNRKPFQYFKRHELSDFPDIEELLDGQLTDAERLKYHVMSHYDGKGNVKTRDIYLPFAKCQAGTPTSMYKDYVTTLTNFYNAEMENQNLNVDNRTHQYKVISTMIRKIASTFFVLYQVKIPHSYEV